MDAIFRLSGGQRKLSAPLWGWPISCDLLLIVSCDDRGPIKCVQSKKEKKKRQEGISLSLSPMSKYNSWACFGRLFLSRTDQISRVTQKTFFLFLFFRFLFFWSVLEYYSRLFFGVVSTRDLISPPPSPLLLSLCVASVLHFVCAYIYEIARRLSHCCRCCWEEVCSRSNFVHLHIYVCVCAQQQKKWGWGIASRTFSGVDGKNIPSIIYRATLGAWRARVSCRLMHIISAATAAAALFDSL
jgi:hypothetical protein